MVQIPDWVFEFHGHKCPAMPIGYRAGLAAMKTLGVARASNKELYLVCENGPAHATACFLDGVMAATGCTYGKGNAEKKNYGKNAITLVDVKTKRAVRMAMNPDFQKKGLSSEFVKLRSQGIEPKDIPPEVVNPLIEKILKAGDEELFKIGEVHESPIRGPKGTFNWHECEICNEIVFENTTRLVDGKKVCIPCFEAH
ncbi:MAG: formylmethanofuran dehydrogenase [Candidatus Latescibacteria bacterium]|nr:formylmethanofuran dehydrogenase [Candidatus Latescibacterota bacterium]